MKQSEIKAIEERLLAAPRDSNFSYECSQLVEALRESYEQDAIATLHIHKLESLLGKICYLATPAKEVIAE